MKVVSIFSGKGGVGKTSVSIMFASWLKYHKKERVVAYDFETPESRMLNKRNADLGILKLKTASLSKFTEGDDFYPVGAIKGRPEGYTEKELDAIATSLGKAKQSGPGYIICDFPGRFEKREAVYHLAKCGLVDLFVFPIVPEEQSVTSLFVITNMLRQKRFFQGVPDDYHQETLCFWNMVTRNDFRNGMDIIPKYEAMISAMGIPISPTRVKFADSVKRISSAPVFVTTTVAYPRSNFLRAFPPLPGEDKPYIENLFQEIKDRVDAVGKHEGGSK